MTDIFGYYQDGVWRSMNEVIAKREPLYTHDYIVKLLKTGDIVLQRDSPDGFIYIYNSFDEISPINQDLAKQVIRSDFRIVRQDWVEGWTYGNKTGKTRWIIEN